MERNRGLDWPSSGCGRPDEFFGALAGNMCRRSLRGLIGIQAGIKLTNAPTAHACPANGCKEDVPCPMFPPKIAARFV
jgi:hypothetical protein